jgi:oxygen-independent coproporphyrinogen III oxidase
VAGRDDLIGSYLKALDRELITLGEPREVETLFFGGGTPTHLPFERLEQLFQLVRRWLPLARGGEFSVEANPIDFDAKKAAVLASAGVTRLSLGAQSFNSGKLQLLERDHNAGQIRTAMELSRTFAKSISLDLIFGVPGETLADWEQDLSAALALAPDHLSTYGLTFEKGTAFWSRLSHGDLARVDEDVERQMYEAAIDRLTATGFEHYEVSSFARRAVATGREGTTLRCRHNENYWLDGPYYAFGPGASRFIAGRRETNHRSTTTYIQRMLAGRSPVAEAEQLGPEDAARERLVFGLRRLEGIDLDVFAAQTGYTAGELGGNALTRFLELELLAITGNRLHLTRRGLLVSDSIWPNFLRA